MLGIISDVHGNDVALSAVLTALAEQGVDQIFSLGDVAGYYSGFNECVELLRDHQIDVPEPIRVRAVVALERILAIGS